MSLIAYLALMLPAMAGETEEPLAIRVGDAVGVPGGIVTIVLRTYASRPIGQGQLCFSSPTSSPQERPLETIQGSEVFGVFPDVSSTHTDFLQQDPQMFVLEFESPTASINAVDGPLAVVFVQLRDSVQPGDTFDLELDLVNSLASDENGQPIALGARNGRLRVRAVGEPIGVGANAEKTVPGDVALLTFQTSEAFPVSRGRVGFRYDPDIATAAPIVTMDPRNGSAIFSVELPQPGQVVVTFESPDDTLNTVPGDLVSVRIPTRPSIPSGTLSPVSLDPTLTFLEDASSSTVPLDLEDDLLEFTDPATVSLGTAGNLRMRTLPDDLLQLTWNETCGVGTGFAIYRGDLALGYASLALEPSFCSVSGNSAAVSVGPGDADFFLVVPIGNGEEGSYGVDSLGGARTPAGTVCFPQAAPVACAP